MWFLNDSSITGAIYNLSLILSELRWLWRCSGKLLKCYKVLCDTSRHVASLMIRYVGPVVVGNVGDNTVSIYRVHASETQQLSWPSNATVKR